MANADDAVDADGLVEDEYWLTVNGLRTSNSFVSQGVSVRHRDWRYKRIAGKGQPCEAA